MAFCYGQKISFSGKNGNIQSMDMDELIQKIKDDPRNHSYAERGIPPIFQVNRNAVILIIGQAPGRKVEETLIPFNDASGRKLIDWMGISKEVFYSEKIGILPMDFYYPGKGKTGDLPPRRFMAEYHNEMRMFMPGIQMTILVGNYAVNHYLTERKYANLTETVRHYQEYLPGYFPIVHPSPLNARWHKNNPWFMNEVVPVLRQHVNSILKGE